MLRILDHLEKLPLLLAISETGSLRQAAFRFNVSQPAITRSLRVLEEACGGELVKRTQKGASFTPRGYAVLALAKEITETVDQHVARLEALDSNLSGAITIGTYESIAVYYWPWILSELHTVLPNVEISMRTDRSAHLQKGLIKGDFDLVVSVAPTVHRGVVIRPLFRDYFELYGRAGQGAVAPTTAILFEDGMAPFQDEIRVALRRFGTLANRRILTDSFEVVRAMTLGGGGIGVMPTRVAATASFGPGAKGLTPLTEGSLQKKTEHVIAASYLATRRENPVISSVLKVVEARIS